jgi:NADH-quinone oxidoreductase subunit D
LWCLIDKLIWEERGFERDRSPELLEIRCVFLEEFPAAWKEFENLFEKK